MPLVLGENNTLVAAQSGAVVSMDENSGAANWTWQAPELDAPDLSAALADGGATGGLLDTSTGEQDEYTLDAAGNPTILMLPAPLTQFDSVNQTAVVNGTAAFVSTPEISLAENLPWDEPSGGTGYSQSASGFVSKDVTVIGWVDGSKIKFPPISSVTSNTISAFASASDPFRGNGFECGAAVLSLSEGFRTLISSDADRQYINALLVFNSANSRPPDQIDVGALGGAGDFRLLNRYQATLTSVGNVLVAARPQRHTTVVGNTPDPCHTGIAPLSLTAPQEHPESGSRGITQLNLHSYQLAEGRIGDEGQHVNVTLNWCSATGITRCDFGNYQNLTPWIWSIIRFDAMGNLISSDSAVPDEQVFPTYFIYEDGKLVNQKPQIDAGAFTAYDGSSQVHAKDIQ